MSKRLWVGLDVGADTMSVCVVNDQGAQVREEVLPTSAATLDGLLRPMRRGNIVAIGMEAGGTSIHLARSLTRMKYPVVVFECRQISAYLSMRGNKTDRNDARCIAEVTRTGRGVVSEIVVKSTECQRIRSMLTLRQQFIRMRVAGEGGIGSLFRLHGGKLKRSYSAAALRREVRDEVTRLRKHEKIDLRDDVEPMLALTVAPFGNGAAIISVPREGTAGPKVAGTIRTSILFGSWTGPADRESDARKRRNPCPP